MHLLFTGDVKNVMTEKSPIGMKDVKWYTHNATIGFLVAGRSEGKTLVDDITYSHNHYSRSIQNKICESYVMMPAVSVNSSKIVAKVQDLKFSWPCW
jgi:hypothetical protein